MEKNMIELGQEVTDSVTGLRGYVIGRTMWLTGCATVGIQSRVDKDGKVPEIEWVDEIRLEEYSGEGKISAVGGPQPTPQRRTAGA